MSADGSAEPMVLDSDILFQPSDTSVPVIHPSMKHLGCIWIDSTYVDHTCAVDRWQQRHPHPPTLCLLFQNDRCSAGSGCNQIHAQPAYIQAVQKVLETLPHNDCCSYHGDLASRREDFQDMLSHHPLEWRRDGSPAVPITPGLLAITKYWDRFLKAERVTKKKQRGRPFRFTAQRVCQLHQEEQCKYGVDCKNIHLCRKFWAEQVAAGMVEVSAAGTMGSAEEEQSSDSASASSANEMSSSGSVAKTLASVAQAVLDNGAKIAIAGSSMHQEAMGSCQTIQLQQRDLSPSNKVPIHTNPLPKVVSPCHVQLPMVAMTKPLQPPMLRPQQPGPIASPGILTLDGKRMASTHVHEHTESISLIPSAPSDVPDSSNLSPSHSPMNSRASPERSRWLKNRLQVVPPSQRVHMPLQLSEHSAAKLAASVATWKPMTNPQQSVLVRTSSAPPVFPSNMVQLTTSPPMLPAAQQLAVPSLFPLHTAVPGVRSIQVGVPTPNAPAAAPLPPAVQMPQGSFSQIPQTVWCSAQPQSPSNRTSDQKDTNAAGIGTNSATASSSSMPTFGPHSSPCLGDAMGPVAKASKPADGVMSREEIRRILASLHRHHVIQDGVPLPQFPAEE